MKKIYICLVGTVCIVFFLLVSPSISFASEVKKFDTDIGIQIEKSDKKKEIIKPSVIDDGNKKEIKMLPNTGEMLSSLIVILLGISLLIFSIGVISIKQLYQMPSWEV